MTVSERQRSCRGPSRLAHHGDLRHRSAASLRNYIDYCSSGKIRAFRYFEWKATSVTAAEFYGAVIPSDLHVLVNSAVVHS